MTPEELTQAIANAITPPITTLGQKIDDLSAQVSVLTDAAIDRLSRTVERQGATTDRLIELALQHRPPSIA